MKNKKTFLGLVLVEHLALGGKVDDIRLVSGLTANILVAGIGVGVLIRFFQSADRHRFRHGIGIIPQRRKE